MDRAIMLDDIMEKHWQTFGFTPGTLSLAIGIIDRFFAAGLKHNTKLHLIGLAALMIAAKYEEQFTFSDERFIEYIRSLMINKEDFYAMELLVFKGMKYMLTFPTPYTFLVEYMKYVAPAGGCVDQFALYLLDLCAIESCMLLYKPSHLAASAMYVSLCTFRVHNTTALIRKLEERSGYPEKELKEVTKKIVGFHERCLCSQLTPYHKYYAVNQLCF